MANEVIHDNPPAKEDAISMDTNVDLAVTANDIQDKSMEDFIREQVPATKDMPKDEEEVLKETSDSTDESDTKEKDEEDETEESEEAKDEKAESEETKEETKEEDSKTKEPIPYERFEQVNNEKNTFKAQLDEVQPMVQNYKSITQFCTDYSITAEQFQKALEVQALLNTNPEEALKRITPIIESLQGYVGNKLPADLQAKVDTGKMELDDAREMARLRARQQFGEQNTKRLQAQNEKAQAENYRREVQQSVANWETAKRSSDPDYKPKAKDTDLDGLWELSRDKFLALLNRVDGKGNHVNPVKTPSEMVTLMERAYKETKEMFLKINGRKPPTKAKLSSNGSVHADESLAGKRIEDAKSMTEAIHIGLAQRARW